MKVEARVFKNNGDSNILAGASITIENSFVVTGLKVINGSNGLFVSMPSRKTDDGQWKDTSFPINKETRDLIQQTVLDKYNEGDKYNKGDKDDMPF